MDPKTTQILLGVAGAASADPPLYVDDVFSPYLYDGTSATQTITNGIDLSGEGGLTWIKSRNVVDNHLLYDTERGATKQLISNSTNGETTESRFSSFNSNGFTVTTNDNEINDSAYDYTSWSFRKAPGFFDCVTWSGNGVNGRSISHSLGSKPGFFIVKCTSHGSENWNVYHTSVGATKYLTLDTTNQANTSSSLWNNTEPTATVFTVGDGGGLNATGRTYVAYLFADDDQSFGTGRDESIIKCGSYTGNGSTHNFVNVGFEPQWLLIKRTDGDGQNWHIFDVMRGQW